MTANSKFGIRLIRLARATPSAHRLSVPCFQALYGSETSALQDSAIPEELLEILHCHRTNKRCKGSNTTNPFGISVRSYLCEPN